MLPNSDTFLKRTSKAHDDALMQFINIWIGLGCTLLLYEVCYSNSNKYGSSAAVAVGLLVRYILKLGHPQVARWIFISLTCILVGLLPILGSGVRTPAFAFLPAIIMLSGWLLGRRVMLLIAAIMAALVVTFALIETARIWTPPISMRTPSDFAVTWIATMLIACVVVWSKLLAFESSIHRENELQVLAEDARARFEVLLSVMHDGILLVDQDGNVEYANRHFCEQFDLDCQAQSLFGVSASQVIDLISEKYKNPSIAIGRISELVELKEPSIGEEVPMKSGRTLLRDFIPINLGNGKISRMWHHRDVTALYQARERLEALSNMDGLTGIANRRKFDDFFPKERQRCIRDNKPMSLVMIDVDHFKRFNDQYGHIAGDHCLKGVAAAMLSCAHRPSDLMGRYGGEEFFALLPNTDSSGAARVAERICRAVADLNIEHAGSNIAKHVTVSAGVVTALPLGEISANEILEAADASLYESKRNGRNRIHTRTLDRSMQL